MTATKKRAKKFRERFNFLDHLYKLEPTDRSNRYICPVCGGNDLTVSDSGAYSCWHGCPSSDIRKALDQYGGNMGHYYSETIREPERKPVHVSKRKDLRAAVYPFRGLKPASILHYGIEFDPNNYDIYFPYYLPGGRFADYKIRPLRSKDIYWQGRVDEDGRRATNAKFVGFFGEQLCTRKSLLITEGELDAVAAHIMTDGKVSCVSVPHGAKSAPKYIKSRLEWVEKYDKVFICFDMDQDGQEAADEVMELIKPGKAFRMVLNRKDANQYLQEAYDPKTKEYFSKRFEQVKQEFQEAWWAAQPRYAEFIYHNKDDVMDRLSGRGKQVYGVTSGFPELDDITGGIRKGEVTTIFADTGQGKSSFSRHIAAHRLRSNDRVMLVSLEEPILEALMQLWCHYFKKDSEPKGANKPNLTVDELAIVDRMFREQQIVPVNLSSTQSPDTVHEVLEYGVRMHDVDVIVFDNVTAGVAGIENKIPVIEKYFSIAQDIAKEYNIPVIMISHTKRRENPNKPPIVTDGKGSSAIEQFSNVVITIHNSVARVIKNRRDGNVGEFNLYWNKTNRCYQPKPSPVPKPTGFGEQSLNAKEEPRPYPGRMVRQPVRSGGSESTTYEVEQDPEPPKAADSNGNVGSNLQPGLQASGRQKDIVYRGERRENRLNMVENDKSLSKTTARLYWKPKNIGDFPEPYITPPDFTNLWEVLGQIRGRLGNIADEDNAGGERRKVEANTG